MSDLKRKRRRSSDLATKRLKLSLMNLEPSSVPNSQTKCRTQLQKLVRSAKPSDLMDSLMSGRVLSPAISLPNSFSKRKNSVFDNQRDESQKQKLDLASCFCRIAGLSPIFSEEKKDESCVRNLENDYDFELPVMKEKTKPIFKEEQKRPASEKGPVRANTPIVRLAVKFNYRPERKQKKLEVRDYEGLSRFCVLGNLNGPRP